MHGLLRRPSSPSSGPRSSSRPAQPAPRSCGRAGAVNGASSHLARVSRLRDRVLSAAAHLLLHHHRRDHRRRQDDGKVLKGNRRGRDHREAAQTRPRRAAQRLRTASIHSASSVNRQQGGVLADGVNSIIACLCGASYRPTLISRNLPQSPPQSPAISPPTSPPRPRPSSVSSHAFSSRLLTGSPPNTTFSQNNGIIALTKCGLHPPRCAPASHSSAHTTVNRPPSSQLEAVNPSPPLTARGERRCASRSAGFACAGWLIFIGLFGKVASPLLARAPAPPPLPLCVCVWRERGELTRGELTLPYTSGRRGDGLHPDADRRRGSRSRASPRRKFIPHQLRAAAD